MSRIVRIALVLLIASLSHHLHSQQLPESHGTPKKFIQSFYDWYIPIALGDNPGPAWRVALDRKGGIFSGELAHKLRADLDAQNKQRGYVVGLNFDPFLNSQDPNDKYEVVSVTQKGSYYLVNVHGVSSTGADTSSVTVRVKNMHGQWVVVDFLYPDGHDLLTILTALSAERDKSASKR